ncbi:MAG TPA: hypothetical protein VKW70_07375 [Terriglobia bacterium]|nr:hypothetical protein [Terriglobia bacterium]
MNHICKPMLGWVGLYILVLGLGFIALGSSGRGADPAAPSVIACRVMEGGASRQFGVSIVIFHYRDAADRDRLGNFLRHYDGTTVEFQVKNSAWQKATLLRLKTCFGRGLLIFPVSEVRLAPGDEFMLRSPRDASQ